MSHVCDNGILRTEHCASLPGRMRQLFPRTESRAAADHAPFDFPGFVIFRGQHPVAVAGYDREADGTISVMPPTLFVPFDPQLMADIIDVLVPAVVQAVEKNRPAGLRCLLDLNQDCAVAEALQRNRFTNVASVETWQLRPATSEFGHAEAVRGMVITRRETSDRTLEQMLQRAIDDSADLIVLPRPSAATLLTSWQHDRSTVLTAVKGSEPVGLAAYQTRVSSASPSVVVSLEYIGVDPAYRRLGVASFLLQAAIQDVARYHAASEAEIVMQARVDRANTAAVTWYRHCGFQCVDVHVLHILDPANFRSAVPSVGAKS